MSELAEKLYTAEQVRMLDACAIEQHGIAGYELMSRAGAALFREACERYPDAPGWVVICGAGNNGGDGYLVARLALEAGLNVRLYALKSPDQLKGDAHTAAEDWQKAGGTILNWPPSGDHVQTDLVVDALLGTGLDRPVEGQYQQAIEWMNRQQCPRLAVDIPSGLNADTGQAMAAVVKADVTVSFIGLKRGLFTCDGPDFTGKLVFNSLQVPDGTYDAVDKCGYNIREQFLSDHLKPRNRNTHKGQFGHLLVAGGCSGMAGAVSPGWRSRLALRFRAGEYCHRCAARRHPEPDQAGIDGRGHFRTDRPGSVTGKGFRNCRWTRAGKQAMVTTNFAGLS